MAKLRCHVPTDQISDPILDFKQTVVAEGLIVSIKIMYRSFSVSQKFQSFTVLALWQETLYMYSAHRSHQLRGMLIGSPHA